MSLVIGFEAKRAFKNNTGLGNYSRMLICGLADAHQDVRCFLYSPDMNGEYRSFFSGYANISTRMPTGFDKNMPNLWRSCGVSMHLKGDKVDIFHGLSHELPHGIPGSIKKVVTMHDLIVWRYPQYYSLFDRVAHRVKQRHSCKNADLVVAISEQTKRDLVDMMHIPEEKIRVIYQSCDPMFWRPIDTASIQRARKDYHLPEKYVVCVGTIEERKNQANVVRAMAEVPEDVHLVIVGRPHGRYINEVNAAIRKNKLQDRVRIVSNAEFEDFPALYAGALTSVYVSQFEGFGIPILESMCCDTPVVTSNVSSMPEAGGDAALYVDPNNVSEIAKQITSVVTNPDLRSKLVEKGRAQREKFTQEKIIGDFYALYRSLVPEESDE
ncbi:MAG: glycosyltransferase family 4 protein [Bacteroidales bacterium]|nr:glycosyltransferase family 4 protein [Bacteroidales bacterium]